MTKPLHPIFPVIALICAATFWGVSWYPLRLLDSMGVHGVWTVLVVFSGSFVLGTILLRPRWGDLTRYPVLMLLLAVGSAITNLGFILALLNGEVMRVLLLFYLSPVWTVILGALLLDEPITAQSIRTITLAMAGALVMLWDVETGLPLPRTEADWLALGAGVGFALTNVMARKGRAIHLHSKSIAIWGGAAVAALIWIVIMGLPMPSISATAWSILLGVGSLVLILATLAVIYGVSQMPVQRSAVILLFELVVGALSAYLLAGEVMRAAEWVGGTLIVIASLSASRVK